MGSFSNQPDFGTIVQTVDAFPKTNIKNRAIYIGVADANATITVTPMEQDTSVTFKGITGGAFLPVLVKSIDSVTGILPENVLLVG